MKSLTSLGVGGQFPFPLPFPFPPWEESGFECAIGVTGNEQAVLALGVNIFENDHDLDMDDGLSIEVVEETESLLAASEVGARCLKPPILGRRFRMDDLPRVEEGPGDPYGLESEGLGVSRKFTLLGVGVGVGGGILISMNSCRDTSSVLLGISKNRFDFLHCLLFDVSSVISRDFSSWGR